MDPLSFPITVTISTIEGITSLPGNPWIKLSDLERFLIGKKLIPLERIEIDGEQVISAKAFFEIDRWVTNCGFSGVSFMGQPAIAHTEDALGPFQKIPAVYFRKLRGVYRDALSRVSVEQNDGEMIAADAQDKAGFGESDWREVVINRAEMSAYIDGLTGNTTKASTPTMGRVSQQGIHRAVRQLVQNNPAATIRQADELAASMGASRQIVREELRKARSKEGMIMKVGRPRKNPQNVLSA